jgi:hypothetical protein
MSGSMIARRSDDAFFKEPRQPKKRGPGGFPIGPRTIRRQKENAILRKKVPDNRCELGPVLMELLGVNVCSKHAVCWAHTKKSRFLTTSEDWQDAAHSCLPCHDYVEPLGHKKMAVLVKAAIARRPKKEKEPPWQAKN